MLARQLLTQRVAVRAFSAGVVRRNLIQDLYIKELKAFKPTPLSAKDAESATRPWKQPVAPAVPTGEVDATQLNEYEAAEVEVASGSAAAEEVSEEWFVLEEPEDNHH
jgi:F-type H+-transporting ATPase subunit h